MRSLAMLAWLITIPVCLRAQTTSQAAPASDPRAVSLAQQSIAALTNGVPVSDVTLTGNATWIAGSDTQTGTVTLKALGGSESRMDLALAGGSRSELRDGATGTPIGQWIDPNNSSNFFAITNCLTDAAWFFPAFGSLAGGSNAVLTYVGQESRNGLAVQHLRSYSLQLLQLPSTSPSVQQLSTTDFFLDSRTLLPLAIVFNSHPDGDPATNIPIEIDFSSYRSTSGVMIPQSIQRYVQGTLALDLSITSATFNTGLSLSSFIVSQ